MGVRITDVSGVEYIELTAGNEVRICWDYSEEVVVLTLASAAEIVAALQAALDQVGQPVAAREPRSWTEGPIPADVTVIQDGEDDIWERGSYGFWSSKSYGAMSEAGLLHDYSPLTEVRA